MVDKLEHLLKQIAIAEKEDNVLRQTDLLREAVETAAESEGHGSAQHIRLLSEYGGMLKYIGKTKEAIRSLSEVCSYLAPCCSLAMTDEYCTAVINLAGAYKYDGNFEESERLYLEAKNALPEKDYRYASICNNLAAVYEQTGRMKEAVESMEEALALIPDSEEWTDKYVTSLGNLSSALIDLSKELSLNNTQRDALLQRAGEHLASGITKLTASGHTDQIVFASLLNQRATLRAMQGFFEDALADYRAAYKVCLEKLGPESSACSVIRTNMDRLKASSGPESTGE